MPREFLGSRFGGPGGKKRLFTYLIAERTSGFLAGRRAIGQKRRPGRVGEGIPGWLTTGTSRPSNVVTRDGGIVEPPRPPPTGKRLC